MTNINVTPGTGKIVATETIGGLEYQTVFSGFGGAGAFTKPADVTGSRFPVLAIRPLATVTTQFTRPADTTAYADEEAISDSTSAPTSGGFTLTGCARVSGGAGVIKDIILGLSTQAATALQGELWIFDQSVTNINDNTAFSIGDADRDKAVVPGISFTMNRKGGLNYSCHLPNLEIGFTCIGTANLRFLVKAKNAYTPASAEVFTVRMKIDQGWQ